MALPARAEGSRSRGSTRRSDARPWSAGKRCTGGSATGSTEEERMLARDALVNNPQRLLETGKPCASKGCMHGLGQGRRKRAVAIRYLAGVLCYSATPACQRKSQARLLRKWKLYQRVQELHAAGMSLRKIGEELGLARNTVRKYFRQAPDPPLPTPRPLRASQLDPYEDYLLQRWSQGERNAAQLHREISERGYPGSKSMVKAYVGHLRTTTADGSPPRSRKERARAISPRALRWPPFTQA